MYAVVTFTNDGSGDTSASEVPTNWLINDNTQCQWPSTSKNISSLIAKRAQPNDTWSKEDVTVEVLGVSLETARKKAEDLDYTSSEELNVGRGKRKIIPKHYDSSSSDAEVVSKGVKRNLIVPPPPSFPKDFEERTCNTINSSLSNSTPTVLPSVHTVVADINHFSGRSTEEDDTYINLPTLPDEVRPAFPISSTVDIEATPIVIAEIINEAENKNDVETIVKEHFQKIERMFSSINLNLKNINSRLGKLEKTASVVNDEEDTTAVQEYLPLKEIVEINTFENLMKTNREAAILFKKYISNTGGNCPKDNVVRILRKIFTNECAMKCSWLGHRNNFGVSKLYTLNIIYEVVLTAFPQLKEQEFEQFCGEWLRFAKQRFTREKKT